MRSQDRAKFVKVPSHGHELGHRFLPGLALAAPDGRHGGPSTGDKGAMRTSLESTLDGHLKREHVAAAWLVEPILRGISHGL